MIPASAPTRLYLVGLVGPPSYQGRNDRVTHAVVATSPEEAAAMVPVKDGWALEGVTDHGTPRPPEEVTEHAYDMPGMPPMRHLLAHPWPEDMGNSPVRADLPGGEVRISWPMRSRASVAETRALIASLEALCEAVESGRLEEGS